MNQLPARPSLSHKDETRRQALLPGGVPRYVRCYDNRGESLDNYTVVFTGRKGDGLYVGMNSGPFHPQGICLHGQSNNSRERVDLDRKTGWPPALGRRNHLGWRIRYEDLPAACRRVVLQDYIELWDIRGAQLCEGHNCDNYADHMRDGGKWYCDEDVALVDAQRVAREKEAEHVSAK
jgi:hypothetical protein